MAEELTKDERELLDKLAAAIEVEFDAQPLENQQIATAIRALLSALSAREAELAEVRGENERMRGALEIFKNGDFDSERNNVYAAVSEIARAALSPKGGE